MLVMYGLELGTEYYDDGNNFHATEDVRAKVDNLIIFNTLPFLSA